MAYGLEHAKVRYEDCLPDDIAYAESSWMEVMHPVYVPSSLQAERQRSRIESTMVAGILMVSYPLGSILDREIFVMGNSLGKKDAS